MELTEQLRQTLLLVVALLALICFFSSFMLFCCAAYIKANVDSRMKLIETYNSDVLPAIFLFVGVINLAQNLTCLFVCLKMRNIDNREGLMRMLFPVLIGGIVLVVFEVSTAIASFVHISILDDEFEAGLKKAMTEYVNGKELKVEMDTVQSEYGCCGDLDYTQWFEYSWLDPQYLKASSGGSKKYYQTDGKYYSDDTPFSCCDVRSPRPCIHHHVNDNSKHHNYNYEVETTLYVRGCRIVLMEIYSGVLCTVALIALLIATVKTTALLLFRLLQTSLVAAQEGNDWVATTPAYIYFLKAPDPDMEQKKLLEGASDSEEASGSEGNISISRSGTDENTNNETDYDDDDTEAVYHSNRNYQHYTGDVENKSHNRPTWQPLSFAPVSPGTGYLQDTDMRHLSHGGDSALQNSWSKQPGAFQSGSFVAENHSDSYSQGHIGHDNSSGYDDHKYTGVPNNDTDLYKLWTERNVLSSDQQLLPTHELSEIGNNGKGSGSGVAAVPSDRCVMSNEAPGKQVKFEPQKSPLGGDHQGFAGKLLSRLASSLKSTKKSRDSSNSYKYSLVRTNSDSDEQEDEEEQEEDAEEGKDTEEEEEEAEDEEEKEICSFEEGYGTHSDRDTENKRCTRPCGTRNTAEELGSTINNVINDNVKCRTSQIVSAHGNERYPASNNVIYSQKYYQRRLIDTPCGSDVPIEASTDATSSTSRASVSSYHEENEKSGEYKVKQLKQRHRAQRIVLEADPCSKNILGTRDSKPAEQKTISKSVSFPSTVDPAGVNVVHSQGHNGLHKSTSNVALENITHGQTLSEHRNYNPSTGWSNPNNNFRAPGYVEQADTHRADHARYNVHWPKYTRLAEVAGTHDSSETDYEAASNESGDFNSSHKRRFVPRYTPYPFEIMGHNTINSEEYDLIPTNIRQSREPTSYNPFKKLPRETSDIAELSNTDVPESDTEMSHMVAAAATSACPDHCKRNQQQEEESRYMFRTEEFSKHDLQRAKPQWPLTDGKLDQPAIVDCSSQGLSTAHCGQDHDEHVSISRTYTDHIDTKMDVPLELKSATKPFAFPLMQPSPSSFEMSSSVRNHIRSYQRRSVFLASPLSHSRTNSPINSSSPHLALFSSPLLDSPMETSTPIVCTKRMLDSFKCQTLSTAACDNSSIQPAYLKIQEATRRDPVPRFDNSKHTGVDDINKRQGSLPDLFPTMAGTEKQSMAASQQLAAVEGTLLIDEVFTSTEVCDVVHGVTTTEHSFSQGRVLISPFN